MYAHYASKKHYHVIKGRGSVKYWDNRLPKWYPRKFRPFKKLKCHYLTAEDWKVCPIARGAGRGHNVYPNNSGVAALYHIEPHKHRIIPT